jgi:hypothetical protein
VEAEMPFFLVIKDIEDELGWLDPAERWELFLRPLRAALAAEGLGDILEADSLVAPVEGRPSFVGDEIAMEVNDLHRARELIASIEQQARAAKGLSEGDAVGGA